MVTPNKEQFYQNLDENTYCGADWCKKLYAYQMYDNGFLKRIYSRLDELGREKVKYIYGLYVKTEIAREIEQMKGAGKWLAEQTDKNYERMVKDCQKNSKKILLTNLSSEELILMLEKLK